MTAPAVRTLPPQAPAKPVSTGEEEAKRSFLRMVSHELRTPLNSIIGFSEILERELYGPLGSPQYVEYAGIVRDSGLKLLRMVNQVLEIVKLEGGAADIERRMEPLAPVVAEAIKACAEEAAARGVRIETEGLDRLAPASADVRALKTALTNLLQNAICFSPEGGAVRVRGVAGYGTVTLEIIDEGEGVEPSDLARLMRPFEQGENALTRSIHGAGLGLPIARLLAEAQGGWLELSSVPGVGFTSAITLLRA